MYNGDGYYKFIMSNWTSLTNVFITSLAILFFINPLRKISKSRKALMFMLSKEIATFLFFGLLFVDQLATTLVIRPYWFKYVYLSISMPAISIRLHLIAMACSRIHAIYFPFSYSKWSKKRFIQKVCILIWVISTILAPISNYVELNKIDFPFAIFSRSRYLEKFSIIFSMGLYALISVKFLWIKYKVASSAHMMEGTTMMEKDNWKISIACLVSLVPFLLDFVVLQIIQSITIEKMSNLMNDLMITLKVPIFYFSQISEEICLTIICDDFRRLIRRQFRSIFAWTFWCISMGRWKLMDENNENKVAVIDAIHSSQLFGKN